MSEFLRELGYNPLPYWLLAGFTFVFLLLSALLPPKPSDKGFGRLNSPLIFGLLLLATMIAWRWPALFYYKPVNPDEAQFLAGALSMLARGSFWWVDPTTSGPLVVLPLALPGVFGLPIDYAHGRIVALLLEWGSVYFCYLTLRHVHGEKMGRLFVLPLACFMTFLLFWDFVPYCSELSPLFLCSFATWLGFTAFQTDGAIRSRTRLAACGFVLGIIPFSKFQVLPLGASIGLSIVVWTLCQRNTRTGKIAKDLLYLVGGVVIGTGSMLTSLWYSGYWIDVYQSYWVHNLHYAQARGLPWSESGYILSYLTDFSWGFTSFHYGTLLFLISGALALRRAAWRPMLLTWALLLAAYFAMLAPGRLYPHYLLFLCFPLTLAAGMQFGYVLASQSARFFSVFIAAFLAIGVGTQFIDRASDRHSLHRLVRGANPRDQVVGIINQLSKKGDTIAVWGWRPELYVETQLPQATREAHTEAQLSEHPQQSYYCARFIADLRASKPAFLVDSVGPDDYLLTNRAKQGHEIIPELDAYITENYAQLDTGNSFRLYVRRTRLGNTVPAQSPH